MGFVLFVSRFLKNPAWTTTHKKRVKGTGLIRGVLCNSCNVFIAKSENNAIRYGVTNIQLPERLRAFADYLEKRQYPFMHPDEAPPIPKLMKSSYNELKKQLKDVQYKKKIPDFPKSGKMIKPLQILYDAVRLLPRFYKK